MVGGLHGALGGELARVAAHADVDEAGVGPELGTDAELARVLRVGLEQLGHGRGHRGLRLRAHALDDLLVDEAELPHLRGDARERVARHPLLLLVLRAVAEGAARVGAVLVEVAVDLGLDDHGALARAHPLGGLLHREVHGERVHAVDAPRGDAEALTAHREARVGADLVGARRDRVEVVLDEEGDRELPGGGEVHRLEHRADLTRAVAEVVDGEVGRAAVPLRPRVARGHRGAAADDRVGAERARLEPLQVHRAAAAAAVALGEAEDLGERALQHGLQLGRDERREVERGPRDVRDRLGEELVVPAMGSVDGVGRAEADDRADRAALLADARVGGAVHEALARELEHGLLEGADEVQLAEHAGEQSGVGRLPVGGRRRQLDPGRSGLEAPLRGHEGMLSHD